MNITKKRIVKDLEKKRLPKKSKFEDLTKMDIGWRDNCENPSEEPKEPVKRNVISAENFDDLPLEPRLKKILNKNGYDKMTKIQKSAIPIVLQNNKVLIKAETGSGKTLAYSVPLAQYLINLSETEEKISRDHGTYAIIFSPTRELCLQIENTLKKILNPFFHFITPGSLMGGEQPKKEKSRIRKGINILICTPGRLIYHLNNTKSLNFSRLQYLIFDESDRILDMGFEKEMIMCLRGIKKLAPWIFAKGKESSLLTTKGMKVNLVSATLGKKVNSLSTQLMENEVRVGFETKEDEKKSLDEENIIDLRNTIPESIQQHYLSVPNPKFKWLYLLAFLNYHQDSKLIVFLSTCDCVDYFMGLLRNINWLNLLKDKADREENTDKEIIFKDQIFSLHGKMKHSDRKIAFSKFDKLETGVLVSTDVASRGLDFKGVKWVVQFDVHPSLKEYANRIGRTARLNENGSSLVLINQDSEKPYIDCLTNFGANIQEMNRFKLLQEFTIFAQKRYNAERKGTRVFTSDLKEIEDEKYEILLFLKLLVKDTLKNNPNLDQLEKQVIYL